MTIEEVKQRIAELKPQEERAWEEAQEFEKSVEYQKPHKHLETLYNTWSTLHKTVEALGLVLNDLTRPPK